MVEWTNVAAESGRRASDEAKNKSQDYTVVKTEVVGRGKNISKEIDGLFLGANESHRRLALTRANEFDGVVIVLVLSIEYFTD